MGQIVNTALVKVRSTSVSTPIPRLSNSTLLHSVIGHAVSAPVFKTADTFTETNPTPSTNALISHTSDTRSAAPSFSIASSTVVAVDNTQTLPSELSPPDRPDANVVVLDSPISPPVQQNDSPIQTSIAHISQNPSLHHTAALTTTSPVTSPTAVATATEVQTSWIDRHQELTRTRLQQPHHQALIHSPFPPLPPVPSPNWPHELVPQRAGRPYRPAGVRRPPLRPPTPPEQLEIDAEQFDALCTRSEVELVPVRLGDKGAGGEGRDERLRLDMRFMGRYLEERASTEAKDRSESKRGIRVEKSRSTAVEFLETVEGLFGEEGLERVLTEQLDPIEVCLRLRTCSTTIFLIASVNHYRAKF